MSAAARRTPSGTPSASSAVTRPTPSGSVGVWGRTKCVVCPSVSNNVGTAVRLGEGTPSMSVACNYSPMPLTFGAPPSFSPLSYACQPGTTMNNNNQCQQIMPNNML